MCVCLSCLLDSEINTRLNSKCACPAAILSRSSINNLSIKMAVLEDGVEDEASNTLHQYSYESMEMVERV